jgi:hypothetical protein
MKRKIKVWCETVVYSVSLTKVTISESPLDGVHLEKALADIHCVPGRLVTCIFYLRGLIHSHDIPDSDSASLRQDSSTFDLKQRSGMRATYSARTGTCYVVMTRGPRNYYKNKVNRVTRADGRPHICNITVFEDLDNDRFVSSDYG